MHARASKDGGRLDQEGEEAEVSFFFWVGEDFSRNGGNSAVAKRENKLTCCFLTSYFKADMQRGFNRGREISKRTTGEPETQVKE